MTFRDQAFRHLASYRKQLFPLLDAGTFIHLGREHRKDHILPKSNHQENILETYRSHFFASEHCAIKLHKYFHHLNSSQALCINLFFPLAAEGRLDLLFQFIGLPAKAPLDPRFESESTLEVATRRTSFDFHVRTELARDLYVEVKYTEDGFGGARDDEEHRTKFQKIYVPLLKKTKYLVPACAERSFFFRNYQVLRNLLHITDTSDVAFLYPRANMKVATQAAHAREAFLTQAGRGKLHLIELEDFVTYLESHTTASPLAKHFSALREKYLGFVR